MLLGETMGGIRAIGAPAYQPTASNAPSAMKLTFARLPRPMQRTFADDLKWAVAVLVGVLIAFLALGDSDTGLLFGSVIGVTLAIVGMNVARRLRR